MSLRHLLSVSGGLAGALMGVAPLAAQTLELTASPATATIYRLKEADRSLVRLGVGAAKLKLEKDESNTVVVRLEGFKELRRAFPKGPDYKDKKVTLVLNRRLVQVNARPADATLYVNGAAGGQGQAEVEVEEGGSTTVELRKPGYAPVRRVYQWDKGSTQYPVTSDQLELVDRRVAVTAAVTGAEVFLGDTKLGDGVADVVVPGGGCITIRVQDAGWVPVERRYCNTAEAPPPPVADRVPLTVRLVTLNAPEGAQVVVNNRAVGTGPQSIRVPDGECAEVRVEQSGFMPWEREYCLRDSAPPPPREQAVALQADEAHGASVSSEQANLNVTLEISPKLTEAQAWRLLSNGVYRVFEIMESIDSQTGYLRTGWQLRSWASGRVVRTRIIVRRQSDSPLRYVIKVASERNLDPTGSSRDDENFVPWDRLLLEYSGVIAEIQAALK